MTTKFREGHAEALNEPYKWKSHHKVFVCSMSDLFHEAVPTEFIEQVIDVIDNTPQHCYQILTKRAERMEAYFRHHRVPANVWLGVTVENKAAKYRIDHLRSLDASVLFLSCEPLLEDLGVMDLSGIDWVIVGGESGRSARPMQKEWVMNIKRQVENQHACFFFKQWGAWGSDGVKRSKYANGKLLEGSVIQNMPV